MRALWVFGLWWGAVASAAPLEASHSGTWTGDAIVWNTKLTTDRSGDAFALDRPLPRGVRLDSDSLSPIRDEAGRVTGLEPLHHSQIHHLTVRQPAELGAVDISAPIVEGEIVQRIVLEGAQFHPGPSHGIHKHVRYWAQDGVTRADRVRADLAAENRRARPGQQPLYFVADERLAGGLGGEIVPAGGGAGSMLALCALLAGVLALLGALYRGLSHAARVERSAVYIEKNFGG